MFIFGEKALNIHEYDKVSIKTPEKHMKLVHPQNGGNVKFSAIKLNVGIARCILSKDLSNLDMVFESLSSFLRFQTIINTQHDNLRLNKIKIENLRDFSQKTRIGELAQGITYLFAQEYLNYPIIVDFEGYVKRENPTVIISDETPDFILQNQANFDYSLIESKGHYEIKNKSTKGKLSKALNQCISGERIMNTLGRNYTLIKSYGVCVKFQNEQAQSDSIIQYVDPENDENNNNYNIDVIRYHYASWFLLMGDLRIYERLLSKEFIKELDLKQYVKESINNKEYFIFKYFPFRMFSTKDSIFRYYNMRYIRNYGIHANVIDILMGKDVDYSEIKFQDSVMYDSNEYEFFKDGTIIKVR